MFYWPRHIERQLSTDGRRAGQHLLSTAWGQNCLFRHWPLSARYWILPPAPGALIPRQIGRHESRQVPVVLERSSLIGDLERDEGVCVYVGRPREIKHGSANSVRVPAERSFPDCNVDTADTEQGFDGRHRNDDSSRTAFLLIFGVVALVAGLVMVIGHNVWSGGDGQPF
jgi:hypothetical protein